MKTITFIFNLLFAVSLATTILHEGPVGISLCEQICLNTVDCDVFTFVPVHLICFGANQTNTFEGSPVIRLVKKGGTSNCQPGTKTFKSRANGQVCRQKKGSAGSLNQSSFKLRMKGYRETIKDNSTFMYKCFKEKKSWDKALEQCKKDGGLLAKMEDKFKWAFIQKLANVPVDGYDLWVGLHDAQENGIFVWADGSSLRDKNMFNYVSFSWLLSRGKDCAYMKSNVQLILHRRPCQSETPFLCEVIIKHD